ncbi:MAG: 6-carboxytetrahydropterin synthase [Candidatus Omnitrophica bacterium]|nr:6-carboxytetrahydropterin synthase [Candidatus Omnitrophota bacterium]
MYTVIREIHFSYAHRLMFHPGKCAHLHGHNGVVHIEISSPDLDDQAMVVDFDQIRRTIGEWLDEHLDHRTILWEKDVLAGVLKNAGEPVVLMREHPTAEALARWIYEEAQKLGLAVSSVKIWETPNSCAGYSSR